MGYHPVLPPLNPTPPSQRRLLTKEDEEGRVSLYKPTVRYTAESQNIGGRGTPCMIPALSTVQSKSRVDHDELKQAAEALNEAVEKAKHANAEAAKLLDRDFNTKNMCELHHAVEWTCKLKQAEEAARHAKAMSIDRQVKRADELTKSKTAFVAFQQGTRFARY